MYSFERRCWSPTASVLVKPFWKPTQSWCFTVILLPQSSTFPVCCEVFHCHTHSCSTTAFVSCLCHFNNPLKQQLSDILVHATQELESIERKRQGNYAKKISTNVTGYFIQSWWILHLSHDEHLPPKKEIFVSLGNTDLQNVPRNIEPPEASIDPGGGEINKYTIIIRRLTSTTFILDAICLPTVDSEVMNKHMQKTTQHIKQLQHIANSACKEKRKKKRQHLQPNFVLLLSGHCGIFFMFWSDRIQSRATNKGRSVTAPAPRSEDPILTCLICGARLQTHAIAQLHNPDRASSQFVLSGTRENFISPSLSTWWQKQ